VSIFVQFFLVALQDFSISISAIQGYQWSMDLVPIESACDFLLVSNSTLGPILHRFGVMRALCAHDSTLFNPNFGGVPVAPDRPCWSSTCAWSLSYSAVKLFSKNSNLFEHGTLTLRTDGESDRRTTCNLITALCASIGR